MRKTSFVAVFTAFSSILFGLSGCSCSKDVCVAVAMPLTGDIGTEGQGIKRAVTLAVDQANASHKYLYSIGVVSFDDRADPKEAVNVANMIVSNPKVIGVVGHYNSSCSIPASRVYARSGLAMISPASTNPNLTQQQMAPSWVYPRSVFRVVPTDDVQGSFAAEFAFQKLKYRKFCVLHDKTSYGEGLAGEFKKRFESLGGTVLSFDGISIGDKDFKALLTRLKEGSPEGVFFGGLYPECGLLIKQARELGLKAPFFSGDGSKTDGLFDVAGDEAEGSYFTITGIPVEELATAKTFMAQYHQAFPGEPIKPFDHFGYEAAGVFLDALSASGPKPDREKVLEALPHVRHDGLLGVTQFDDKGDTLSKIITMTRVENRKFVTVPFTVPSS